MSTTTLSQRLRELRDAIFKAQRGNYEEMFEQCIAQAAAQEAQAPVAEVYDVFMGGPMPSGSPKEHAWEARGMNGNWWCLNCGVCGGNSTAPANVGPCADRGPSDTCSGEPSQAIGKQTPVAMTDNEILQFARKDKHGVELSLMLRGDVLLGDFQRNVIGLLRSFPLYRPPMSSEARDLAIEALEAIVRYSERDINTHEEDDILAKVDQALSALRGG